MPDNAPTFRFALDQRVRWAVDPTSVYTIEQCRYADDGTCAYVLADVYGVLTAWVPETALAEG